MDDLKLCKVEKIKSQMSKNDLRSFAIVVLIAGLAVELSRRYTNAETDKMLREFVMITRRTIKGWPGNPGQRELAWAALAFITWEGKIPEDMGMLMLSHAALTLTTDLSDVLKDHRKIKLLEPVLPSAQMIMTWVDYSDRNFEAYAKADALVDELYKYFDNN